MAVRNRTYLKGKWVQGYKPLELDYDDVWDSHFNLDEDVLVLGVALSQLDMDIEANTGVAKFPCPENMTIVSAFVQVSTAPVGSSAIWDINVEGASILNTLITIAGGTFSGLTTDFTDADVDANEYFTIDCDQIGATTPGQNAVLMIFYKKR